MSPVLAVVLLVGAQRLVELLVDRRNTYRLVAAGGVEHGRRHYPLFILLHGAWLVTLPLVVPAERWPTPALLAAFLALQPLRLWCILSLEGRWTTRIIVPRRTPRLRRGPYRWLRHPNYCIVAAEIPLLPLAFGAWRHALAFGLLNAALLLWRVRVEEQAWAKSAIGKYS